MTIRLIKTHDPTKNARLIAQIDENASITERGLNDNEKKLKDHESSETAHSAKAIIYENRNVHSELTQIQSRINNLILNTSGKDITEVVDARVDYTGKIFTTLKSLLDNYLPKVIANEKQITVLLPSKSKIDRFWLDPLDFGAKGDGVTNDSAAFSQIEGGYNNQIVNLNDKTFVVTAFPNNNKYANGTFKLADGSKTLSADYSLVARTGNNSSVYLGRDAGKNSLLYNYESASLGSYNNVGIGYEALLNNVKGYRNTAVGYRAMKSNVQGYNNVAIGDYALHDNVGVHTNSDDDAGSRNTAVGTNAGRYNTTGRKNVYVGRNAGHASTVGSHNTALGYNAYSGTVTEGVAHDVKTASFNTHVGYNAGFNTNADFNQTLGSFALYENETGKANVAIGHQSNSSNVNANNNVAIGVDAMRNHKDDDGHDNTAVGTQAMLNIVTGASNTAVGRNALSTTIAGNNANNFSGCVGLGANTRISGDYQMQLGNSGVTVYSYGAVQNRSDLRDKADIQDTTLGIEFINKLRPVDYRWDYRDDYVEFYEEEDEFGQLITKTRKLEKDGSKKRIRYHHGLIAQEVRAVMDEMGVDFGGYQDHSINGGDDVLSIGYEEMVAPLIKANQEMFAMIQNLQTRLGELESKQPPEVPVV
ncbi:hypothetical protein AS888_20870 [Peribacillus simplex]|uniref:Peptidase S74 domain-containing protein n=1 Tax=Peribacillus simplex TaxID=1478 RepID=A0A109MXA4_9BACI|nr:tail fiber domain-containing protein [Peribacillus simplex]KWW17966.1 hypothetical protein AS888_20870 [Peribacillus simplex]